MHTQHIYERKTQASISSWIQMDFRHAVTCCEEEAMTLKARVLLEAPAQKSQ